MKGWQIIVSGLLPFLIGMSALLVILKSNHSEYFTLGTMLFIMFSWYIPIYWARHYFGVKAFYGMGFIIALLQCVACSLVLGATLKDEQFWFFVMPVLGLAIVAFMICIKVFYKQRSELVEIND